MSIIMKQSDYARRCGVQRQAVSAWIARGHLTPPAVTEDGQIVVTLADQQLRARRSPAKAAAALARRPVAELEKEKPAQMPVSPAVAVPAVPDLLSYRTVREQANAELAQMLLAEKRRDLIPRQAAELAMKEIGLAVRQAWEAAAHEIVDLARATDDRAVAIDAVRSRVKQLLRTMSERMKAEGATLFGEGGGPA